MSKVWLSEVFHADELHCCQHDACNLPDLKRPFGWHSEKCIDGIRTKNLSNNSSRMISNLFIRFIFTLLFCVSIYEIF